MISDLLEFVPDNVGGRLWNDYDHTQGTGAGIAGNPAVWSPGEVPFVYARGTRSKLLEFSPEYPGGPWGVQDRTFGTEVVAIAGDPAVWSPAGGGTQHVFVRGIDNNLLEFVDDGLNEQGWSVYDHTQDTGYGIAGNPAVWSPGEVPFVYARGTAGQLLEFSPDYPGGPWGVQDRTFGTEVEAIAGDPAVWSPAGGGTQHVFVRGIDNLLEFVDDGLNEQGWSVYDHTQDTGYGIAGNQAVWSPGEVPFVYSRGTAANLLEFSPDYPGGPWGAQDHTADTGKPIAGDPAVWSPSGGGTQHIFARGIYNNLLEFVPDSLGPDGQLWSAYDHTADTGVQVSGNPAAWSADLMPHIYVPGIATA